MSKKRFKRFKGFFIKRKTTFIIIVILIILSLFPRGVEIFNNNPIFGFDQGRDYLAVKNIVDNHKLTLIGAELGAGSAGILGIFHGPFYYYFLSFFYLLFNGNPIGGVWMSFIFSLASVLMMFFLTKKIFNQSTAFIASILIIFSIPVASQARFFWNPHFPTFFIILFFYFLFLWSEKKKINYFLASFLASFIYNFEFAVAIPLCFSIIIYSIFIFKKEISSYLYLIAGFILGFLPMILFEMRHNFMAVKGIMNYVLATSHMNNNYINLLNNHLISFSNSFINTFSINFSYSLLLLVIFLISVLFFIVKEKNPDIKNFLFYLFSLPFITLIVFMFLNNSVYHYYLTHLSLAYIILFSYIIYSLEKRRNKRYFYLSLLIIFIFAIFGITTAVKTTIYDYSDYGGTAKLKGKIDALDYIYKDAKNKNFNLLVFSPPIYTYAYDYLISWYGKKQYNYIPGNEKKGIFYLLIEKDPYQPWTYEGWLETAINTGEVIETKVLPSGFIVQKRIE